MRVAGGVAKGFPLKVPPGGETRPTADRVRAALFDMLSASGADFTRVLDLYAGSGALGIEALSRGAGWCDFVEARARACQTIRENLERTGFAARARVLCVPVQRCFGRLAGPYTLVIADPPYGDSAALDAVAKVTQPGLLAPGAVLALEVTARVEPPPCFGPLERVRTRRYGDSALALYRAGGNVDARTLSGSL